MTIIQEQIEDLRAASAEYEARQAERTSADQDWFVNQPVQVGQRSQRRWDWHNCFCV